MNEKEVEVVEDVNLIDIILISNEVQKKKFSVEIYFGDPEGRGKSIVWKDIDEIRTPISSHLVFRIGTSTYCNQLRIELSKDLQSFRVEKKDEFGKKVVEICQYRGLYDKNTIF